MASSGTILSLFFAAALRLVSNGESSVHASPLTVQALVGQDVVLPCSFKMSGVAEFPTVEWSKEGLTPDVVLLHRDGFEVQDMKHEFFEFRTSLFIRELKNGNVSLRLAAVRSSDAGTYRCKKLWRVGPDHVSTVKLLVGAVSTPTLSLVALRGDGVTVRCSSGCWLPQPLMELLDDEGSLIYPQVLEEERGRLDCSTVTLVAALQSATRSITCRVRHATFNQRRHTKILLPALCVFNRQTLGVAVGLAVVGCLLFSALAVFFYTKHRPQCRMCLFQRQNTQESVVSIDLTDEPFLPDSLDGGGANVVESSIGAPPTCSCRTGGCPSNRYSPLAGLPMRTEPQL